jgi:ubiquinol-cytochrome c reductase cytochrome b subunit
MPFTDLSRSRGLQFRPLSKIAFYVFVANFLILMQLGAKHVESPFIEFGQISTVLYFSHFLIIVPMVSLFENSLVELHSNSVSYATNGKKVALDNSVAANVELNAKPVSSSLNYTDSQYNSIFAYSTLEENNKRSFAAKKSDVSL